MISRRNFCVGLAGLIAAPYVIRNSSMLMPVRDRSIRIVYGIHADPWQNHINLPIGAIRAFSGKPPRGWLPFDGRIITKDKYPELFRLTNLNPYQDMTLAMSGCVPALEETPLSMTGGWWLACADDN